MKSFYETIVAEGGFAGQFFDVAQGPANTDVINILLSAGDGTLTGNAPINLVSTGTLGAPRSLSIAGTEQPGRMFFLSLRNTDIATNPVTIIATTDINGGGPSFIVSSQLTYLFIYESSGNWRAYVQNVTNVAATNSRAFAFFSG